MVTIGEGVRLGAHRLGDQRHRLLAVADGVIWIVAFALALLLRFDFGVDGQWWSGALKVGLVAALLHVALGWVLRLYAGRHRLGSLDEAVLVALVVLFSGAALTAVLQMRSL